MGQSDPTDWTISSVKSGHLRSVIYGQPTSVLTLLNESQVDEALAAARAIEDEMVRASVLVALAPRLNEAQVDVALAAARAIKEGEWYGASAVEALTRRLSGVQVDEALAASQATEDEEDQALALVQHLSRAQVDEALAAARAIEDEAVLTNVLVALVPHLRGAQVDEAMAAARAIENKGNRVRVLEAQAPQLNEAQVEALLSAIRLIKNATDRLDILLAVCKSKATPGLLRAIRNYMFELIERSLEGEVRVKLLDSLIIRRNVVHASVIGKNTVAAIVRHIVEISEQWPWV